MLNPFSIVLIILIIFCIVFTRSIKQILFNIIILTSVIELFIEVGYFVRIGNADINYRTFCEILLLFISSFVVFRSGRIKLTIFYKYGIWFFIASILGLSFLVLIPSGVQVGTIDASWEDILVNGVQLTTPRLSGFVIQQTFQFLILIITLWAVYLSFKKEDMLRILKWFSSIIKVFLIIGIIEFIIKYIFKFSFYGEIVKLFYGISESSIEEARIRGYGIELVGFTKEASHYAYVLFTSLIILLGQKNIVQSKVMNKWIYICLFLMFFCMSFSVVLFGSGVVFIYTLFYWNNITRSKRIRSQAIIGILIAIIIIIFITKLSSLSTSGFFSRRILSLVEEFNVITSNSWQNQSTALEWSNRVRLLSVYVSFKAFLTRPLFGFGFGAITCHGSTIMMLCGVGVIGLFFWTKFFFSFLVSQFERINLKYLKWVILIFLLVNSLNSLALRPYYELHTYILAIALVTLFIKKNVDESINNYSRI